MLYFSPQCLYKYSLILILDVLDILCDLSTKLTKNFVIYWWTNVD